MPHNTIDSLDAITSSDLKLESDSYNFPPTMDEIPEAIASIKKSCLYVLWSTAQYVENKEFWLSRDPDLPNADESLLLEGVVKACGVLSRALSDNGYLLDRFNTLGLEHPSYLDAQLFGAGVVVYQLFEGYSPFSTKIFQVFKAHIRIWAYIERLYFLLIENMSIQPLRFNEEMMTDPDFVTRWFIRTENLLQSIKKSHRSTNDLYLYECCDCNGFGLSKGKYVIKYSKNSAYSIESELMMYDKLPYPNFICPKGTGVCTYQDKDFMSHTVGFLILPFMHKGSLQHNLKDVRWPVALCWAREIAYAVHLTHISNLVLCDLKPDNILINNAGKLLMCDLGGFVRPGEDIMFKTSAYSDDTKVASKKFDIYCYGMVLFAIFTADYVTPSSLNARALLFETIKGLKVDVTRGSLKESGLRGKAKKEIFDLAFKCTDPREEERPSAYEILELLDEIALYQSEPAQTEASHEVASSGDEEAMQMEASHEAASRGDEEAMQMET